MKTAQQKFEESFKNLIATHYRNTLSENVKRGLEAKKKQNDKVNKS